MKDEKYNVTRKQIKEFYDNQAVVQKTKTHPLKADRVIQLLHLNTAVIIK